jgi:cytochrome P450
VSIHIDGSNCPNVFDAGLPTIDYQHVKDPDEAHDIIRNARQRASIAIGPHGPELLSYELVRTVLRDQRFSVPEGMFLAGQGITSGPLWDLANKLIICLEGEEHHRLRRLVSKAFTPRAVAGLRTTITAVINGLVDSATRDGHCDVVTDIGRRYPIPIICALLGAPAEDWESFSRWTADIFKLFDWDVAANESAILTSWRELDAYVNDMIARRRHTLTDDLISGLICAEDQGDHLSADQLCKLVAALLIGGTDTTGHQLAASVYVLCDHPDQWAALAKHPELAANAVEETMRHTPISFTTVRFADEDVELGGVIVPAGTLVVANTAAANRDPAAYEDPDRLDITREVAPAIHSFGGGTHHCLGAHLARLELTEALAVMARRMPNVRRAGPAPWKSLTSLTGPTTLPIEFDTERRCEPALTS